MVEEENVDPVAAGGWFVEGEGDLVRSCLTVLGRKEGFGPAVVGATWKKTGEVEKWERGFLISFTGQC